MKRPSSLAIAAGCIALYLLIAAVHAAVEQRWWNVAGGVVLLCAAVFFLRDLFADSRKPAKRQDRSASE